MMMDLSVEAEAFGAKIKLSEDEVPVVIYHSHTATDPYPSRTDSGLAAEPDAHYVLVGTADPDVALVCSYRIVDGVITAEPITVVDSGDGAAQSRFDVPDPSSPAHPAHNHSTNDKE